MLRMERALGRNGLSAKRALTVIALNLALVAGLGAITACGKVAELKPPPGKPMPVKPKFAATVPTVDDLLTPPPNARPSNVEELLRRSEVRRGDRFDLPPPDGGDAPTAPASNSTSTTATAPGTNPQ